MTQSTETLLAEAERLASDQPQAASRLLETLLEREPDHVVAAVRLGRLALAGGQASRAAELADRALARQPRNRWALVLKGRASEALGQFNAAHATWTALADLSRDISLQPFARPTKGEAAYRQGVGRSRRAYEASSVAEDWLDGADASRALDRIDALIAIVDVPGLERLRRRLSAGAVRDYLDFRLQFRMQVYAEPLAIADRIFQAPELQSRRHQIAQLAARAALTLEDAPAIARWLPDADPDDPDGQQTLLNGIWKRDPERGERLSRRLAYSKAGSRNAEALHIFLGLVQGAPEEARRRLAAHLARHGSLKTRPSIELAMAAASVWWTLGRWDAYAEAFDVYFEGFGLENPVPKDGRPLTFDRLGVEGLSPRSGGPLVSVILTVFNAGRTLDYALESLLAQTHANLEIIAVDDASTDDSLGRLNALAARDDRVQVIANPVNSGTYVCKNIALERAQGDYWVCHDADDWAHPRRVERHLQVMQANPELVVTRSRWLRIDEDGMPFIRRSTGSWTHINPGSPFYRREVLDAVGGYDRVRIDGDLDHWRRTLDHFGPERLAQLRQPLTLGLLHPGSLTRSGAGAQNDELYSPIRSAYRLAGLEWRRAQVDRAPLRLPADTEPRAFPAPPGVDVD